MNVEQEADKNHRLGAMRMLENLAEEFRKSSGVAYANDDEVRAKNHKDIARELDSRWKKLRIEFEAKWPEYKSNRV
jgi:hypothetical protein